jgi:hypothetical protein
MPALNHVSMSVEAKYFRSQSSKGYLESDVVGDEMYVRAFWDEDDDDVPVVFLRLSESSDSYLYIAVAWPGKSIVGTAFGSTDKQARRLLLEDMERRGWNFT